LNVTGAGESGKSTVMKQMRINFGKRYTENDYLERIPAIRGNAISGMSAMIKYVEANGYAVQDKS